MKYTWILSATLLLSALAACSANENNKTEAATNSMQTGDENPGVTLVAADNASLPSFNMKDLEGNTVNLQSLKGKKVFVNLWASWCPPCRGEMPSIEKLYATVNKEKVAFVMLSFHENPAAASQFKQTNNLSLPVYFPAEQPPAVFKTDGIPATFIFDVQGNLIKQNVGAEDYDTDAYRQLLQ